MKLRDLQYIVALGEERHFNRAALRCHVSQPSLSKQVQKLEDFLGVALFERTNRKVSVTPVGEAVIRHARLALQETEAIRQLGRDAGDPLKGDLRLGIIPTLAPYLLPRILPAIGQSLPNIRLRLHEGTTDQILRDLRQGGLDAILLAVPLEEEDMEEHLLFEEAFYLAVPPDHVLAGKKTIASEDIADETLLLLEDGHCLRSQALQLCRLASPATDDFSATSLETLRQMVAAGYGVTLVPEMSLPTQPDGVRYISFHDPVPTRAIGLVTRKTSPRRLLISRLSDVIRRGVGMPKGGRTQVVPLHA